MTVLENPAAAHQIRVRLAPPAPWPGRSGQLLTVSCTCLAVTGRRGRHAYQVIEARDLFPAAEAIAAWRAWHAEQGVMV